MGVIGKIFNWKEEKVKMNSLEKVLEFHEVFGCTINDEFLMVTHLDILTRYNLISEELDELEFAFVEKNIVEVLDALVDLEYVINGTLISFGMRYLYDTKSKSEEIEFNNLCREIRESLKVFKDELNKFTNGYEECMVESLLTMQKALNQLFVLFDLEDVREQAMDEVHASNMSKLGDDGKPIYRESDKKVLKSSNYVEPNLKQFVENHRLYKKWKKRK